MTTSNGSVGTADAEPTSNSTVDAAAYANVASSIVMIGTLPRSTCATIQRVGRRNKALPVTSADLIVERGPGVVVDIGS